MLVLTESKIDKPSCPPHAYISPLRQETPAALRCFNILDTIVHLLKISKSYHTVILRFMN